MTPFAARATAGLGFAGVIATFASFPGAEACGRAFTAFGANLPFPTVTFLNLWYAGIPEFLAGAAALLIAIGLVRKTSDTLLVGAITAVVTGSYSISAVAPSVLILALESRR